MIPIAKPFMGEEEAAAAKEAILSGWVTQGPKVREFEEQFAGYVGARHACAVTNCTTALHCALLSIGVKPGDSVITVSHSFIATANSIRHCGAQPLFVDVDEKTFNISVTECERALKEHASDKIKAILVVHQMGMPCDLGNMIPLAKKYHLPLIEDAACAIGSEISFDRGKSWDHIGKPHGDIACFSFHPRKILVTGEGGMLTTSNPDIDKKLRLLRHQGMSISDLARHESKRVMFEEYKDIGYNYRMTDIQAAIGIEQLKKLPGMIAQRRELASCYHEKLSDIDWVELPHEPEYGRSSWQTYFIKIKDNAPKSRDAIMQHLLDKGIASRRGIMNAHQEQAYNGRTWNLPVSEKLRDTVIHLPIFHTMTKDQVVNIVNNLKDIKKT